MTTKRKLIAFGAVALFGLAAAGAVLLVRGPLGGESGPPTAVIVDQLSLTFPNQDFADEATAVLEQDGYVVDYFEGEEITVDFYLDLAERDYDLILFRVHSAALGDSPEEDFLDWVSLFTAQPYDDEVFQAFEQEAGNTGEFGALSRVRYREGGDPYFGITPYFIRDRMSGDFQDATVVMMGCDSLSTDTTAQAFRDRGAGDVIGWDKAVSASHTDEATLNLLGHLVSHDMPAEEAVAAAMSEVGPDEAYDSTLLLYTPES
jgi:hypothetical protein